MNCAIIYKIVDFGEAGGIVETIVRERALALLEEQYGKKESLVLVYGRKGMGKTSLLQTFIQYKPALYFYET